MAIPNLNPTKKKPTEADQVKLSIGQPKPAATPAVQKPPSLTGQSAPPPPNTATVDPVTGARSAPNAGPQPVAGQPAGAPAQGPQTPQTPTGGPLTGTVADRGNAAADRNVTNTSTSALDQQLRALIANRIGAAGNVDTSGEEALIQDMMQRQLGEQLVNQRASMGRAGFSGIGAMEGDIQRQAALDAQREILGLRRTEDQRAFDNAMRAAGTDLDFRQFGSNDEIRRAQLQALQDYLGLDSGGEATQSALDQLWGDGGARGAGMLADAANATIGGGGFGDSPDKATSGGSTASSTKSGADPANAIPASSPPPGATRNGPASDQMGADVYYDPATRKWYVVGG